MTAAEVEAAGFVLAAGLVTVIGDGNERPPGSDGLAAGAAAGLLVAASGMRSVLVGIGGTGGAGGAGGDC